MPDITIRVGAAIDASLASIFPQVEAVAAKSNAKIRGDAQKTSDAQAKAAAKAGEAQAKEAGKAADAEIKAGQRARDTRGRFLADETANAEREYAKQAAAAEKAAAKAQKAFTSSAMGNYKGIMGARGRIGMGVARAAGVNLDVESNVHNAITADEMAGKLSRKGFQEGQAGEAGQKQDSKEILGDMRTAANAVGMSINEVGEGMDQFINKSGDLAGARSMIADIGKIANSTGADFKKLAADAGVLDLKLGDMPDKANVVKDVLRSLSAQGKLGAIDMADLAAQIPKLVAAAGQFKGGRAEMIKLAGFLAQESAKEGGSGSAAAAATAVASMPQQFKKKNVVKAWKKEGLTPFDSTGTQLNDPSHLIIEALNKTHGNMEKFGALFASTSFSRSAEGLRQVYNRGSAKAKGEGANDADANTAGIKAVQKEMKDLGLATLSAEQVEKDNAERLKETTAKAQLFQNRLEVIAGTLADKVLPAFEKLAPNLLLLVDFGAKIAGWSFENPIPAMMAAFTASAVKANFGSIISTAMAASPILSIALVAGMAAIAIESAVLNLKEKAEANTEKKLAEAQNAKAELAGQAGGGEVTGKAVTDALAKAAELSASIKAVEARKSEDETELGPGNKWLKHVGLSIAEGIGIGGQGEAQVTADTAHLEDMKTMLARINASLAKLGALDGTLKVQVVGGAPGVDAGAQTGSAPQH